MFADAQKAFVFNHSEEGALGGGGLPEGRDQLSNLRQLEKERCGLMPSEMRGLRLRPDRNCEIIDAVGQDWQVTIRRARSALHFGRSINY